MTKILMVCLGNICRSPLAEGILRSKLPNNSFFVDSAGTANYHIGDPPDKRSIAVAKKYGIDISKLRGRQFNINDFNTFDLIYAMDDSNYNDILALTRNNIDKSKLKLILNEVNLDENKNVPDPYYGSDQGFEDVYKMLNQACNSISKKLLQKPN